MSCGVVKLIVPNVGLVVAWESFRSVLLCVIDTLALFVCEVTPVILLDSREFGRCVFGLCRRKHVWYQEPHASIGNGAS